VTNMGLNVVIVGPMVLLGLPAPHAGLALATAASAFLNAGLLYRGLIRNGALRPAPGWRQLIARAGAANLAMGVALWWARGNAEDWAARGVGERAGWLTACILGGTLVYFAVLWLAGFRWSQLRRS